MPQEPLRIEDFRDLAQFDQGQFALGTEFAIELFPRTGGAGFALRFVDHGLDAVVDFPWWDNVESETARWSIEDVPCGDLTEPYYDVDQYFRILIWQVHEVVFIAYGDIAEEAMYTV